MDTWWDDGHYHEMLQNMHSLQVWLIGRGSRGLSSCITVVSKSSHCCNESIASLLGTIFYLGVHWDICRNVWYLSAVHNKRWLQLVVLKGRNTIILVSAIFRSVIFQILCKREAYHHCEAPQASKLKQMGWLYLVSSGWQIWKHPPKSSKKLPSLPPPKKGGPNYFKWWALLSVQYLAPQCSHLNLLPAPAITLTLFTIFNWPGLKSELATLF